MMLADAALDIDQFLNTDLFQTQSPPSCASTPSSPEQGLLTPPQQAPVPSFHDAANEPLPFSFFDDEIKAIDALASSNPFDFLGATTPGGSLLDHTMSGFGSGIPMDLGYSGFNMNMGFNMPMDDALQAMAIDPHLVDTPASTAPMSDFDEHDQDGDDENSINSAGTSPAAAPSPSGSTSSSSKLTLTIAPVKVGGHGKARRGTVQSGGISKKSAVGSSSRISALQHLTAHIPVLPPLSVASSSTTPSPAPSLPATTPASTTTTSAGGKAKSLPKPPAILKAPTSKKGKGKDDINNTQDYAAEDDEDDDVPQDWRPSPEVFSKMTSKEKRQLRNKISARNFRVRRKEYISTLEGDIAERDRLLEAIRSELGSTQSENLALRQEITALKKVLLEGRGTADLPSLNLPPPAPLPVGLGAITAATAVTASFSPAATNAMGEVGMVSCPGFPAPTAGINATVSTSSPSSAPTPSTSTSTSAAFTPNIQKDLPSSPTPGRPFWGGQKRHGLGGITGGGGVTPVHTTLIPEVDMSLWGSVVNAGVGVGNVERGGKNMNINPLLDAIGAGVMGKVRLANGVQVSGGGEKEKENKQPPVVSSMSGFDAFADANMFTMKSLDAYRMQLWGKMAAQHHIQQQAAAATAAAYQQHQQHHAHHHQQITGPASQLRPAYFSPASLSPKSASTMGLGSTLSALLSGKHSGASSSSATAHGLLTPPASPRLGARGSNSNMNAGMGAGTSAMQREREAQAAMLAAVASQTLFKKLGNAFWDAFSGSSSSSSTSTISQTTIMNANANTGSHGIPSSSSVTQMRNWDADKVRKVLEGKAVVRVVDVDPFTNTIIDPPSHSATVSNTNSATSCVSSSTACCVNVADLLEESMRSLTLGRSRSSGGGVGGMNTGPSVNAGEGSM